MSLKSFFTCLLTVLSLLLSSAATSQNADSQISSWILLDAASGERLLGKNDTARLNPGNMVQLMTLYTALDLIEPDYEQRVLETVSPFTKSTQEFSPSARRIYLTPESKPQLLTLLRAIAILGAEDASLAVCSHLSASQDDFVKQMNQNARKIGLRNSQFSSPVSHSDQVSTALDLALLSREIKRRFPFAFAWFSEKEFSFHDHVQRNANLLLWKNNDISGVMASATGTNLIASWSRKSSEKSLPRDIIVAVMGSPSGEKGVADALNLLRVGRVDYETIRLFSSGVPVARLDVLKGNREKVEVGSPDELWVTVKRDQIMSRGTGGITTSLEHLSPLIAPIKAGDPIGTLLVSFEGNPIASFKIVALHDVGEGSFFSRFIDTVRLRMNNTSPKNY